MENQTNEIKKYTLYTQLLNGIVTIVAIVLVALLLLEPSRMTNPNWVIWFLVIVGGFHTFEEYIWPGGFIKWINGSFFRSSDLDKPLSAKNAFFTDATAGIVIMGLLAVIGANYLWLTLGIASIFLINGAWHLTTHITTGAYSPGSVSSALLNLPLSAYILYFYTINGYVGLFELLIAYSIGLGVHIVFFISLRKRFDRTC